MSSKNNNSKSNNSSEANYVGLGIREFRKSKEMTLQDLADIIGSSAGYISEIERGQKSPGSNFLISLKRNFSELDLNKLFEISGDGDPRLEDLTLEQSSGNGESEDGHSKEHALINLIENIRQGPWSDKNKVKMMEAVIAITEVDLDYS